MKTMNENPLISIITVVYNGEKYLEKTIQSVINQTYKNIEYIIIDGGSTDGTLDIIQKYEDKISYFVSEKDEGISDAFNKGIKVANGEYLAFLNAGDYYLHDNTFLEIIKDFDEGTKIISYFAKFKNTTIPKHKLTNNLPLEQKSLLSHQATFIYADIFKEMGLYSTKFKIRMDYEFWMRVLRFYEFKFIEKAIVHYDDGGISSLNRLAVHKEALLINSMYLSPICFIKTLPSLLPRIIFHFCKRVYKKRIKLVFKIKE